MKEFIKKIVIFISAAALLLPVFTFGVSAKEKTKQKKVGAIVGGVLDAFCDDAIKGSVPEYFYTAADRRIMRTDTYFPYQQPEYSVQRRISER